MLELAAALTLAKTTTVYSVVLPGEAVTARPHESYDASLACANDLAMNGESPTIRDFATGRLLATIS